MKWVKLGDVIEPAGSRAGKECRLPVYSVTKHAGFVPSLEYFTKQVFSRDTSAYKVVNPGDFAYATIHLDEGAIGIAPESALISPMYTIFRTRSTVVCSQYLIRFLKSPRALQAYDSMGNGAIHRRRAISFKALSDLKVPLPDLPEQRRIAAILDRADAIRTKRRQQLEHLDSLTQAIFHEMFGHLEPKSTLGDHLVAIETGISAKCEPREADALEWGILKLSAVTHGNFSPLHKAYTGDPSLIQRAQVRAGDLLMTRKNTPDLVGHVALVHEVRDRLVIPDLMFRLTLRYTMNAQFTQSLLMSRSMRPRIRALAGGAAQSMSNISAARLRTLNIPTPPLESQQQFATIAQQITTQRLRLTEALAADDALFASLQSRAFRGEL